MISSKFGKNLIIEISGGSHEKAMFLNISGLPYGVSVTIDDILPLLKERSPIGKSFVTSRIEDDLPLLFNNSSREYEAFDSFITTEETLKFKVENKNFINSHYNLRYPRPSHCDLPAYDKYGNTVNLNGGGPFSARMTVMLCICGAIAIKILSKSDIHVDAFISSVKDMKLANVNLLQPQDSEKMIFYSELANLISDVVSPDDSIGGTICCFATGLPVGLGGAIFDGIDSYLSHLFFSIPGVKGVEFGSGFNGSALLGSENNDEIISYVPSDRKNHCKGKINTTTNNSGGIVGGMTNSMPIVSGIAFKPPASIGKEQFTVDIQSGKMVRRSTIGRHDSCYIQRALPCAKAAMAIGILDKLLEVDDFSKQSSKNDMIYLRNEINCIDAQILSLLEKRNKYSAKIGTYKIQNGISIYDRKRENEILNNIPKAYRNVFYEIIKNSKNIQRKIFDEKKGGGHI